MIDAHGCSKAQMEPQRGTVTVCPGGKPLRGDTEGKTPPEHLQSGGVITSRAQDCGMQRKQHFGIAYSWLWKGKGRDGSWSERSKGWGKRGGKGMKDCCSPKA